MELKKHENWKDKISFCIEKLEKVKEDIRNGAITDYDLTESYTKIYMGDAIKKIDNQIKQLKEGK